MEATTKTKRLIVGSTKFAPNGFIPERYTCNGVNLSPPLTVEGIPEGTKSLAVIAEDPDAPGGTFDHWLIWNLKPQEMIAEGLSGAGTEGRNSFGNTGYQGPCPPSGTHHYHFRIFALDRLLNVEAGMEKGQLNKAMKGHILAEGEIIGLYSQTGKTGNR